MCCTGTVIFQAQSEFLEKLFGKFSLVRNPLDPVRASPHATNKIHKTRLRNNADRKKRVIVNNYKE